MRAAKVDSITEKSRCVDTEKLAKEYLHCGRKTAVRIGTEASARMQIGRKVLWNLKKIQQYLDSVAEQGGVMNGEQKNVQP